MKFKLSRLAVWLLMYMLCLNGLCAQVSQIMLQSSQVTIEFPTSDIRNFEGLVDEQEKYPNEGRFKQTLEDGTVDTIETVPYTQWTTGWKPGDHEAVIDLQSYYSVDTVCLYRHYSETPVAIYTGEPGNWTLLATDELDGLYSWNKHLCERLTRYLRFIANVDKSLPAIEITAVGEEVTIDSIAPVSINDLSLKTVTSGQVIVNWSAPYDDGYYGKASSYRLKYSQTPISSSNWDAATLVETDFPDTANVMETGLLTGLDLGTTYYVAISSVDGFGNESAISNVLTVSTASVDTVAPAVISDVTVVSVDSAQVTIEFSPTGDDDIYDAYDHMIIKYAEHRITEENWSNVGDQITLSYSDALSAYTINNLKKSTRYYFAIKVYDEVGNSSEISNVVGARTTYQSQKIRLLPEMFSLSKEPHITATATIAALGDEQTFIGDPAFGEWEAPLTDFVPAWQEQDTYYPVSGYIDLGEDKDISMVYLFDEGLTGDLEVSYATGGTLEDNIIWKPLFTDPMNKSDVWKFHDDLKITTRYLKLNFTSIGAHLGEIVIYGFVPEDTVPPGIISDLAYEKVTSITADISWTAPGDDGIHDLAESYQLALSTSVISEANWDNATLVNDVTTPKLPKSNESYSFSGLTPDTQYYVAIRTKDDNNNLSEISNVITFTTEPLDEIAPFSINSLSVADISSDAVRLSWVAVGDDSIAGIAERYEIRYSNSPISESNWSSAKLTTSFLTPDSVNTSQFVNLYGLNSETTYYVGIKVFDEVNNSSELSNIVSFTTSATEVLMQPYFDDYAGCNALINAFDNQMRAFGYIREYHNWQWTDPGADLDYHPVDSDYVGYPDNKLRFKLWGDHWDFDDYYKKLDVSGVMVAPCLQQSVSWLADYSVENHFRPTLTLQDDPELPKSYVAHADFMFQYAARYGNTSIEDRLLKLDDGQDRFSGLGYVKYYENWNEPNNWWHGSYGKFSAEQLAAMCSADYDGDLGRMGNTVGVRNADLNSKLVLGGLVGLDLDYIKDMKAWADSARDGSFPCDVINLHHYCNITGDGQTSMEAGASPESDSLKFKVREIRDYIDNNLPGKELWITEFGWDTDPSSDQYCEPIKGYSSEYVQGMWLVRAFLEMYAAGVDRAAVFTLNDGQDPTSGRFASCGVATSRYIDPENRAPKVGWYYIYAMRKTLSKSRFVKEHDAGNENVLMYEFASDSSEKVVYAVWCPTADSVTVPNYKVCVKDLPTPVTLVELVDEDTIGIKSYPEIVNDSITITVSEIPQFIVCGSEPADVVAPAAIESVSYNPVDNTITWLASGDDGFKHKADHYIIKIDTLPITPDSWEQLPVADTVLATTWPKYEESYVLQELAVDTTYYLAIKAYDEVGNASGLSKKIVKMQQIILDTTMLTILSGGESGFELVDEQLSDNPLTKWEESYHDEKQVIIDLGAMYYIPYIYFYREYQKETIDVFIGKTEDVELVGTYKGSTNNSWNTLAIEDTIRYIKLESQSSAYFPAYEIKVIGEKIQAESSDSSDTSATVYSFPIEDLYVSNNTTTTAVLKFTTPGNIDSIYNVSKFLVAYSDTVFSNANWGVANIQEIATVSESLDKNEITIAGLIEGKEYYFAVKSINVNNDTSEISNVATRTSQIILNSSMVWAMQGDSTNVDYNVDEQNKETPFNRWTPDYVEEKSIVVDLKEEYDLTKLRFYREYRKDDINVYIGEPGNWEFWRVEDWINKWTEIDANVKTRYLKFATDTTRTNWPYYEICIYGVIPADREAPDAITDLTATDNLDGSIKLKWTAPSDNDSITKGYYQIRYATEPVTDISWTSSSPVSGQQVYQASNGAEEIIVMLPASIDDYYVAIKAVDGNGNISEISNSAKVSNQIVLSSEMISSYNGGGSPSLLIDEQQSNSPQTIWEPTQSTDKNIEFDFGELWHLSEVSFNRAVSSDTIQIYYLDSIEWKLIGEDASSITGDWISFNCEVYAQNLKVAAPVGSKWSASELKVFGKDDIAPAKVKDLSIEVDGSDVSLSWTGSGDDGILGDAIYYQVWYNNAVMSDTTYENGQLIVDSLAHDALVDLQTVTFAHNESTVGCFAVVAFDNANNKSLISNQVTTESQIILVPSMISYVVGGGDSSLVIDEQLSATPTTKWDALYHSEKEIVFNLEQNFQVIKQWYYREYSKEDIKVYYGEPGNWTFMYTDKYEKVKYNVHQDTIITQYVRFIIDTATYAWPIYEIKLFGSIDRQQPVLRSASLSDNGDLYSSENIASMDEKMSQSLYSADKDYTVTIKNQRIIADWSKVEGWQFGKIEVYSTTGLLVYSGFGEELSVTTRLKPGVYVVHQYLMNDVINIKVIVQ